MHDIDRLDALVINLDHRVDRWEQMIIRWKDSGLLPQIRRYSAYKSSQRHRGCSLSHIYAVLNYFTEHPNKKTVLVFEDDACPTACPTKDEWRRKLTDLLDFSNNNYLNWKVIILSPLLSPGIIEVGRHIRDTSGLSYITRGSNLSSAAVVYHKRSMPYLQRWKYYYETQRRDYLLGIDRVLSRLSVNEQLIANPPLAEQDMSFTSDNPGAFMSSLSKAAQNQSHSILRCLRGQNSDKMLILNAVWTSTTIQLHYVKEIIVAAVITLWLVCFRNRLSRLSQRNRSANSN